MSFLLKKEKKPKNFVNWSEERKKGKNERGMKQAHLRRSLRHSTCPYLHAKWSGVLP